MAIYPTGIPTNTNYPDRVDEQDWIKAARYNEIKKEVLALCTELGISPSGAYATVKARLDAVSFPSGVILIWSGAILDIPTGWVLCDGNNSTPDLTDRFVMGAGGNYAVGATGGANAHTHDDGSYAAASHTHGDGSYTAAGHTHGDGSYACAAHTHAVGSFLGALHTHDMPFGFSTRAGYTNYLIFESRYGGSGTGDGSYITSFTEAKDAFNRLKTYAAGNAAITGVSASTTPGVGGTSGSAGAGVSGTSGSSGADVSGTSGSTSNIPTYHALTYIMKT